MVYWLDTCLKVDYFSFSSSMSFRQTGKGLEWKPKQNPHPHLKNPHLPPKVALHLSQSSVILQSVNPPPEIQYRWMGGKLWDTTSSWRNTERNTRHFLTLANRRRWVFVLKADAIQCALSESSTETCSFLRNLMRVYLGQEQSELPGYSQSLWETKQQSCLTIQTCSR